MGKMTTAYGLRQRPARIYNICPRAPAGLCTHRGTGYPPSLHPLFQNVLISEAQITVPERSEQTPFTVPANSGHRRDTGLS